MKSTTRSSITLALAVCLIALVSASAQDLPPSGVLGIDVVMATSTSGASRPFAVAPLLSPFAIPLAPAFTGVPSRWAHRRRTLGALETEMLLVDQAAVVCAIGDAAGTGALYLLDFRTPYPFTSLIVPTGNPGAYDLADAPWIEAVFVASDDGLGGTLVHGFSYATPGTLTPLQPGALTLPGSPAAGCNRMGIDASTSTLHVPTTSGIYVIDLQPGAPQMSIGASIPTPTHFAACNPTLLWQDGSADWVVMTTSFDGAGLPTEAGWLRWNEFGASSTGTFGLVPNVAPPRPLVPAAGTTEIAVCTDGTSSYAYFLLRDPSPTAFFIRPSAVGVLCCPGGGSTSTHLLEPPVDSGEPFANPSVYDGRVAFESSFGPPFAFTLPDGGEKLNIIYSPLDQLGAASAAGVLAIPQALGGRISTKGMDRPIWTRDGTRVIACTSHFPGAPHPGVPGIEVLDVPLTVPLNGFVGPHTVVPNSTSPNRSIIFPTIYEARLPGQASFLDAFSFCGNAFHDGVGAIASLTLGEIGLFDAQPGGFVQDPDVPNFPAILPPTFADATGSVSPVPDDFGARRAAMNLVPGFGMQGLLTTVAVGSRIVVQPTGYGVFTALGLNLALPPLQVDLPANWTTTTEILSL